MGKFVRIKFLIKLKELAESVLITQHILKILALVCFNSGHLLGSMLLLRPTAFGVLGSKCIHFLNVGSSCCM